ncbi:MAG: hypothetical protein ACOYNL_02770 [Rickettsiales bacterium]
MKKIRNRRTHVEAARKVPMEEVLLNTPQMNAATQALKEMPEMLREELSRYQEEGYLDMHQSMFLRLSSEYSTSMSCALMDIKKEEPFPRTLTDLRERFAIAQNQFIEQVKTNGIAIGEEVVPMIINACGQIANRVETAVVQGFESKKI